MWKPLNLYLGVKDPTSTAKNYKKKRLTEKNILKWIKANKHIVIAGHTHRPTFPKVGQSPYFNDGSCVHPRCITGIEIENGNISLIKWSVETKDDATLYVAKRVIAGPRKLEEYFN